MFYENIFKKKTFRDIKEYLKIKSLTIELIINDGFKARKNLNQISLKLKINRLKYYYTINFLYYIILLLVSIILYGAIIKYHVENYDKVT